MLPSKVFARVTVLFTMPNDCGLEFSYKLPPSVSYSFDSSSPTEMPTGAVATFFSEPTGVIIYLAFSLEPSGTSFIPSSSVKDLMFESEFSESVYTSASCFFAAPFSI